MAREQRILKDLTTLSDEDILKLVQERGLSTNAKGTEVSILMQYDKPFLNFTGNFRPYSYSVEKCKRIVENFEAIKAFAQSNGKRLK